MPGSCSRRSQPASSSGRRSPPSTPAKSAASKTRSSANSSPRSGAKSASVARRRSNLWPSSKKPITRRLWPRPIRPPAAPSSPKPAQLPRSLRPRENRSRPGPHRLQPSQPRLPAGEHRRPRASVAADFKATLYRLTDGRTLTGVIVEQTEKTLTLQTATERATIAKEEIEDSKTTGQSLMPDGLLQPLSPEQDPRFAGVFNDDRTGAFEVGCISKAPCTRNGESNMKKLILPTNTITRAFRCASCTLLCTPACRPAPRRSSRGNSRQADSPPVADEGELSAGVAGWKNFRYRDLGNVPGGIHDAAAAGRRGSGEDAADGRFPLLPRPDLRRATRGPTGATALRGRQVLLLDRRPSRCRRATRSSSSTTPRKSAAAARRRREKSSTCPPGITRRARSTAGSTWAATAGCTSPRIAARRKVTTDENHYKGDWILRCQSEDGQDRGRRPRPGAQALHSQQRARSRAADLLRRHRARQRRRERGHPVLRLRRQKPEAALLRPRRPGPVHDLREVHRPRLLRRPARTTGSAADAVRPGQAASGAGEDRRRRSASAPRPRRRRRASSTPSRKGGKGRIRRSTPSTPRPRNHEARPGGRGARDVHRLARRRPDRPLPVLHPRRPRRQRHATARAVVQFDMKTRPRKVIAFLHPLLQGQVRLHPPRHLQPRRRPQRRQALHHLERQPRRPQLGLLRPDRDAHSEGGTVVSWSCVGCISDAMHALTSSFPRAFRFAHAPYKSGLARFQPRERKLCPA